MIYLVIYLRGQSVVEVSVQSSVQQTRVGPGGWRSDGRVWIPPMAVTALKTDSVNIFMVAASHENVMGG